ncbi:unnamed protein product [Dibothriocephalus latus]|uniref:Uncharacterized protein n=1 Tax=Dibothriocephalus latus TaxID=60516 RepID=A0A3P7LEU5_DIBLA|nr:unnamed protein product [Dibothriocephalus latus]
MRFYPFCLLQKNVWVSGAAYLQRLNRALFLTGNTLEIGKLTGISNPGEKILIGPFPDTLTCVGLIDTSLRSKWLIAGKTSSDARKAVQVDVSTMDTIVFGDVKGWLHFLSISRKALVEAELVNKATILQMATLKDQTIADSNSQTPKRYFAPRNRQVYEERFHAKAIPPCNFKRYKFAKQFLQA